MYKKDFPKGERIWLTEDTFGPENGLKVYYLMTIISGQSKNGWKYAIKELQINKESDVHQRWPLRSLILPAVGSDFCVIRSGDENFLCKAASKQGKSGGKTVMHPVYASYP